MTLLELFNATSTGTTLRLFWDVYNPIYTEPPDMILGIVDTGNLSDAALNSKVKEIKSFSQKEISIWLEQRKESK